MLAVAVAVRHAECAGGRRSVDGGPWRFFGEDHWVNPRLKISSWSSDMVRLWRLYQGGMGAGHLPENGGSLSQSPVMLDAFATMTWAEAELTKK